MRAKRLEIVSLSIPYEEIDYKASEPEEQHSYNENVQDTIERFGFGSVSITAHFLAVLNRLARPQ